MRQSSGTRGADKRASRRAGGHSTTMIVAGAAGVVLFVVSAWAARDELGRLSSTSLLAVCGLCVGGALLLAALLSGGLRNISAEHGRRALRSALDAIASGDFTKVPEAQGDVGPFVEMTRSAGTAILSTRDMLVNVRTHARDATARAQDLAPQAAAVQAAALRTAETAGQGVSASNEIAATAKLAAGDVGQLKDAAMALADAQRRGVEIAGSTQAALRSTLDELGDGGAALRELEQQLEESERELTSLTVVSGEIREFVTLVRKMARQSKLLALNAAMEAARAGEQGSGFAVVAGEVRRLARSSAESADRTEALVNDVIARAEQARLTSQASAASLTRVTASSKRAVDALQDITRLPGSAIAAAGEPVMARTLPLVEGLRLRIEQLVAEAETMAATMRDVQLATGAQQARTHDLAAAANTLARVAAKAADATSHLRLDVATPVEPAPGSAPALAPGLTPA